MKKLILCLIILTGLNLCAAEVFQHPGIPLTRTDLDYVKSNLHLEPWKSGYDALKNDYRSKLDYKVRGPYERIARFPGRNENLGQWRHDMTAVHHMSLMWYFTENEAYAQKARDILVAWADSLKVFDGWESMLDLGDYVHRFVTGADILRSTWSGWREDDTRKLNKLFNDVYWPATGMESRWVGPANKGTLAIASGMALAVFMDDKAKFDLCLDFLISHGPSSLPNTISTGQIGESGRDLGHNYGQWLSMVHAAEIAWKQGYDVYSLLDNRLLAVGEYYSRHARGFDVPFITFGSTDALYHHACASGWPHGRRGMNMLITAYRFRKGIQTPYLDARRVLSPQDPEAFCYYRPGDKSKAKPVKFDFPQLKSVSRGLTPLDIGSSTPAGKADYANGTWTLTGGGEEIWRHGKAKGGDSFFYAFRKVKGNWAMVTRVDSITGPRDNSKAALMYRQSLETDGLKAWVGVVPAKQTEWFMSDWTTIRGNWEKGAREFPDSFPVWLKIERIEKMIYQYWSPDGTSWSCIGAGYFEKLTDEGYLGLAVCSLENGTPATATFSNVSMTGGDGKARMSVPAAPLALLANAADGEVQLRWSQSAGADQYQIQRAEQVNGPYKTLAVTENPSWIDTAVKKGKTYYYKVKASRGALEGDAGNVVKISL